MAIINDELNKLRKLMGVHEKGLPHLLWKNKEDLKDEQKQQLELLQNYKEWRMNINCRTT